MRPRPVQTKAATKPSDISKTIVGAGALSIKKLRYTPKQDAPTAIRTDVKSIGPNRFVRRNAMAPGAISIAIVRMMPVAFNAPTIVRDRSPRRP